MPLSKILARPTNGVSYSKNFTITASENYTASVPEVLDLSVTAGASASGNLSITLRGATPVAIAVLNTDTTAAGVATKIAAGTYPGWTATVVSTTYVRFTATVAGAKTGANTFGAAATGVIATFSVTTLGSDQLGGDVLFDYRKGGLGTYRFDLACAVSVLASNGTLASVTGLTITFPLAGQIQIQGQFVTGQTIILVAQAIQPSGYSLQN